MNRIFMRRRIHKMLYPIRQPAAAIIGWIFGFPFSTVIRRDSRLTVVFNRPGGIFADNSKYFFVYAAEPAGKEERVVFLTSDSSIRNRINDAGGESVQYHSWKSFYLLLKAGKIVLDYYMIPFIYPLTRGAKIVQIWHGAPLKHIELDLNRKRMENRPAWWRKLSEYYDRLIGRYPLHDIVVSTSRGFIKSAFQSCFASKQFIATGYPRNDILFGWPDAGSAAHRLALINVDKRILQEVSSARARGSRICMFVPTFRKEMDDPFSKHVDLSRLSEFALGNNMIFVLKLHPNMHGQYRIGSYPGLLEYPPACDVYPIMPLCDLLITDYSSIFFDFLLLDRPVLFYAYDLDNYLSNDRAMYFDYNAMTPGAKCTDYDELESGIKAIISNGCRDEYADMRGKVRAFTHDYIDNQSHRRLLDSI